MKNLIEYLMLFVIVLLFCPNNFWTFGLCVCSLLIYLLYLICYFKYKKNNKEEKVKQPIEMDFIISIVMIVALNLINKIGVVNLAYGYALVAIFLAHLIKNTINKKSWEENIIKSVNWFDYYSLIYLGGLVVGFMSV